MVDQDSTRERILLAARQEFIEKGLEGARTQSIADRAGVNKAMLHYYFNNKERLYETALSDLFEKFVTSIKLRQGDLKTVKGFIESVVETLFGFHRQEPGFIKLIFREMLSDGENLKKLAPLVRKNSSDGRFFLIHEIVALQQKGELRADIPPMHVALNIMGACAAALGQHLLYPRLVSMPEPERAVFLEARKSALVKMLQSGLSAEK